MATSYRRSSRYSNEDSTLKISHSIYVTNFPDSITSRDLWSTCNAYGTVVDVFIPLKKSKAGVPSRPPHPAVFQKSNGRVGSYANIVNGVSPGIHGPSISSSPAMVATKENLMNHTGVNSWFHILQNANNDFTSEERIVWVDIEGVPLNAWSRETFVRIGKKWGDTLDMEDNADSSFGRKRVCIMTKHPVSILETFKIIVKGRVFMVRVKELFTWNPIFVAHNEKVYMSDDESLHTSKNHEFNTHPNEEESCDEFASDDDVIPDTVFGSNSPSHNRGNGDSVNSKSHDPFELYELLNRKKGGDIHESSPSLSHPPGFTPAVSEKRDEQHTVDDSNNNVVKDVPKVVSAKVMNSSQDVPVESNNEATGQNAAYNGGSVLGVMEDVIRVGQAMGFSMEGCVIDLKRIIGQQGEFLWGNSNYDFVCSDSLGNSGGILCIWEASIFKKDNVTISNNFIAIYGTWLPNNAKILFVVVYAPQHGLRERMLWDYILTILGRWNGESIIMGDFNEVRSSNERHGSCFNPYNARYFDRFISNSGLIDITLEGYAFTWSHPSATKMSKLDRFLVFDGIFTLFPSITAICLDRHISDHLPILLRDVHVDFGPTPFKFYHSWFDEMIKHSWLSISHSDANGMIRFKKNLQDLKLIIRQWVKAKKLDISSSKNDIVIKLGEIDKAMDRGEFDDATILPRFNVPAAHRFKLNFQFHKKLSLSQAEDLERCVSRDEIRKAVWNCGDNKSSGPDGYTFEFFKESRDLLGSDFYDAVEHFFSHGTLNSSRASVLINGSPSKEFSCYRGLKQGDPLAPYLFILVMESLHLSFTKAVDEGLFKGIQLPGLIFISHLFYADDAMFLGEWSDENLKGGRLTLLKSVFGASPIYNMSIFKVPRGVLKIMESIRSRFFNGANQGDKKITWVAWDKALASKKHGGLGVSSYFALNRALLLKWVWCFLSQDGSLWNQIIRTLYGPAIRDQPLYTKYPRLFALELNKEVSIAVKLNASVDNSFHRNVQGGIEMHQMEGLISLLDSVSLSTSCDRWLCDLTGDGEFRVKEVRNFIDDLCLPSLSDPTRWVRSVLIKVNIFTWRARLDCLPTRVNLVRRAVHVESSSCPICSSCEEDTQHILFCCEFARLISRRICRWWELDLHNWSSFQEWHDWFSSIRLSSTIKSLLEGVFSVGWWSIWRFRNCTIFEENPPKRSEVFDDIVLLSFT
nr:RNA-directed DNA polymerase, eukaryota [Tanacetum cinerariifolium]